MASHILYVSNLTVNNFTDAMICFLEVQDFYFCTSSFYSQSILTTLTCY